RRGVGGYRPARAAPCPPGPCGDLCSVTGPAQALTMWAAYAALLPRGDWTGEARDRNEPLRPPPQAPGPGPARAAGGGGRGVEGGKGSRRYVLIQGPQHSSA